MNGKSVLKLNSGYLSLQSTGRSDMTLTVLGQVGFHSALHSIQAKSSQCIASYGEADQWSDLAEIDGVIESRGDSEGTVAMTFSLRDTHYTALRHILYNITSNRPVETSINCEIDVDFYAYGFVVISNTIHASATASAPTGPTAALSFAASGQLGGHTLFEVNSNAEFNRTVDIWAFLWGTTDSDDSEQEERKSKGRGGWSEALSSRTKSLNYTMANPFQDCMSALFGSFVLEFPKIILSATVFGDEESGGRFLFSSSAFNVDLVQPSLRLETDLTLACSDSFDASNKEAVHVQDCALLGPAQLWSYYQALSSRRANLVADAVPNNFVSNLAGPHHFFTGEITNTSHANALHSRLTTTNQHRILQHNLGALDQSSQGECVNLNADDTFQLLGCGDFSAGLVDLHMYLLDREKELASATLRSTWASADTAEGNTEVLIQISDINALWFNVTFSESQQVTKLIFTVRERDTDVLLSGIDLHWGSSEGDSALRWAHLQAHVAVSGAAEMVQITSKLELMNQFYNASLVLMRVEHRDVQTPLDFRNRY